MIQPWMSNKKTYPRRALAADFMIHAYQSTRREGALAAASESCRDKNLGRLQPRTLQPAEPSRPRAGTTPERHFHKAYTPPTPHNLPVSGNDLGHELGAGAAGGAPEAEAQGIAEELAAFAGAGRGRGIGLDLDATAGQGDAGEHGGAGGVIRIGGDPDALGEGSLALLEPISQGGDLGGRDAARGQRISRRSGSCSCCRR